jgi:hypothetical protein
MGVFSRGRRAGKGRKSQVKRERERRLTEKTDLILTFICYTFTRVCSSGLGRNFIYGVPTVFEIFVCYG